MSTVAPFNPRSSLTLLTDKMIGDAYSNVRIVAINIKDIIDVSNSLESINTLNLLKDSIDPIVENMPSLLNIESNFNIIQPVGTNIDSVVNVSNNLNNIDTVIGSLNNLNTVAGSITNVNNVGNNIGSVVNVNSNITAIINLVDFMPVMETLKNETITAAIDAAESKDISTINRISVSESLVEVINKAQQVEDTAANLLIEYDLPSIVRLNEAQTLTNKTLNDPILFGSKNNVVSSAGNYSLNANASIVSLSTNGATTLTLPAFVTNPTGRNFKVAISYVGTDTLAITPEAGITLLWEDGLVPTATQTNGAVDLYEFIYISPTVVIGSRLVANAS